MNAPTDVFAIVQEMSEGNTVPLNLFFCRLTRCMKAAAFLQQCLYWSKRSTMKGGWFAKSYADFEEEIFLGDEAVKKAAVMLVDMGILEVEKRRFNGAPTLHYRLHGQVLIEWLGVLIQFEKEHESDDKPAKFHYKEHLSRFPRVRKSFSEGTEMDFRTVGKRLPRTRKSITENTTKTTTETTLTDEGANAAPPPPPVESSDVAIPDPVTANAVTTSPPIAAAPPAPAKKRARKTNPELFNHPFVSVWRDVFRLNLPEAKMVQLSKMVVTTHGLAQWRAACEAWVLRPYDPTNIGGILDWYSDPARYQSRQPNGRGNYRVPTPPPNSPYAAMSEAEKAAYLASCEPMED